jgi:hypothetical protein
VPNEESDKEKEKQPPVILIAHLEAHLVSGETIQLLPIRHENDVKSDVSKLLEEWAESGFLLRGNIAYPWHQVKQVIVTKIDEMSPQEAHQRMLELEGASRAQMAKGFWKTRETAEGKDDKDKDDKKDDKEGDKKS